MRLSTLGSWDLRQAQELKNNCRRCFKALFFSKPHNYVASAPVAGSKPHKPH